MALRDHGNLCQSWILDCPRFLYFRTGTFKITPSTWQTSIRKSWMCRPVLNLPSYWRNRTNKKGKAATAGAEKMNILKKQMHEIWYTVLLCTYIYIYMCIYICKDSEHVDDRLDLSRIRKKSHRTSRLKLHSKTNSHFTFTIHYFL